MKKSAWTFVFILMVTASCSVTKSLSEGEVLYTGSSAKFKRVGGDWEMNNSSEKISKVYWELWDTPNGALFGLPYLQVLPIRLWWYNMFFTRRNGGFSKWMRVNFGEEPITIEDVAPQLKVDKVVNVYENFGHFGTTGSFNLKYNKRRNKARIKYTFRIRQPYTYRNIEYQIDSVHTLINAPFLSFQQRSRLQPTREFNLNTIKDFKSNLWNHLTDDGFYYLRPEDVIIDADTTVGYKQMDLRIKLDDSHSPVHYQPATIREVELEIENQPQEMLTGKHYRWPSGKIRKRTLDNILNIMPEDTFSLTQTRKAIRNITELGVFSHVDISYIPDADDSTALVSHLKMDVLDASTIGFNIKGNYKNTGYIGPSVGFSMEQLNVFGGAENLKIEGDAYYDFPIGIFKHRISNSSGFSIRNVLSAPIAKAPVKFINSTYALPKEFIALNVDYNDRKDYFKLIGFNASYGVTWKSKPKNAHTLEIINVTYSDVLNSTPRYDTLVMENPLLRTSLENQFIVGSNYTFHYDNSSTVNKRIGIFFEGKIDLSGNLLSLFNAAFKKTESGEREFLGVKYSQYSQFSYDFRAYLRLGSKSQLAFRSQAGIGLSYGNSSQMPYIKQFIIGGTNSLRPITARTAGPGRYIELDRAEVNQTGDLKIEWNLEYRFRLFWKLNGAVWSDAGNIWLLNEDPNRPYSGVRWDHIFEDSYLTAGVGVRLDLKFVTVRFDYGAILYAPIFIDGYKWIWQNKLPFWEPVIAFGYPF